jgi:hypothetical protein
VRLGAFHVATNRCLVGAVPNGDSEHFCHQLGVFARIGAASSSSDARR